MKQRTLLGRREFIVGMSALMATSCVSRMPIERSLQSLEDQQPRGTLFGARLKDPQSFKYNRDTLTARSAASDINIIDLQTGQLRQIPIGCFGHSFAADPLKSGYVGTVEKWADSGAIVDFNKGKLVRALQAPTEYRYFGHLVFDNKGHSFVTAARYGDNKGAILVYNTHNWKLESILSTGGQCTHDIQWASANTLIVANFDSEEFGPSLSWIDAETGKLINQVGVTGAAHILQLNESMILTGAFNAGGAVLIGYNPTTGQKLNPFEEPDYDRDWVLNGECVNMLRLTPELAVITTDRANRLVFWQPGKDQLVSYPMGRDVMGLIAIGRHLIWNDRLNGDLMMTQIENSNLGLIGRTTELAKGFCHSSHLFNQAKFV